MIETLGLAIHIAALVLIFLVFVRLATLVLG